jgi:transposase-like protein
MCSPEVKAAVMAALLAGQSVCSVAKEYNLPKGTVSSWRQRMQRPAGVEGVATCHEEISALLLELVQAQLKGAILRETTVMVDVDYLKSQNVADVAALHGGAEDRTVRMLEAFGNAEDEDLADTTTD